MSSRRLRARLVLFVTTISSTSSSFSEVPCALNCLDPLRLEARDDHSYRLATKYSCRVLRYRSSSLAVVLPSTIRHHHAPLHRVNLAGQDCARMSLPVHPLAQRSSAVIVILPALVASRSGSFYPLRYTPKLAALHLLHITAIGRCPSCAKHYRPRARSSNHTQPFDRLHGQALQNARSRNSGLEVSTAASFRLTALDVDI